MSENDFKNLSGYWTGVYDYAAADEAVPFNAVLCDEAGQISGEIIEPNTFAQAADRELFSSLSGVLDGGSVTFVKHYEALPGAGHTVLYVGEVDARRTKIEGRWRIGPSWSGPFVMNRASDGGAAVLAVGAEAETKSEASA